MSVEVMTLVWKYAPLDGGKLLLALALADHSDDDGLSWPSVARLAMKTRLSERHVQRLLRELEASGFLGIEVGGYVAGESRPSRYTIKLDEMGGRQNVTPPGDAHVTPSVTPASPEPSVEPPEETSKTTPTANGDQLFATPESNSTAPTLDPPQIIWDYWELTFPGKNRGGLTPSRRTALNKALKAVNGELDTCRRAIDGFAHWLKSHPEKNQRVDIGRVFATNLNDSRNLTDKIYGWANDAPSRDAEGHTRSPFYKHEVSRHKQLVVGMYAIPGNERSAELGQQSLAWLRENEGVEPILDETSRVRGWKEIQAS